MPIDNNLNRPFSRRQFLAGAAGAAAGLGAASFLNAPLAAAAGRRTSFGPGPSPSSCGVLFRRHSRKRSSRSST